MRTAHHASLSSLGNMYKIFLAITLILTLASCDLFSTRTPEPPDLGNTFIWTPASTPNTLFENFKGTLEVLDASNYAKCFLGEKDTLISGEKLIYAFTPRTGLDATTKAAFQTWNVTSEQDFLVKLRASLLTNARLSLVFSNLKIDQQNSSSAQITAEYVVSIPVESSSSIPSTISGSLVWTVGLITTEQATKEWRIVAWTDLASGSSTAKTFTDLKAFSL